MAPNDVQNNVAVTGHEVILVPDLVAADDVPSLGEPPVALLRVELRQLGQVGLVELRGCTAPEKDRPASSSKKERKKKKKGWRMETTTTRRSARGCGWCVGVVGVGWRVWCGVVWCGVVCVCSASG